MADRNWRAQQDQRLRKEGVAKVLEYVEQRMRLIDDSSTKLFNAASHRQKLALHELFEARAFLRKEGVPVD